MGLTKIFSLVVISSPPKCENSLNVRGGFPKKSKFEDFCFLTATLNIEQCMKFRADKQLHYQTSLIIGAPMFQHPVWRVF